MDSILSANGHDDSIGSGIMGVALQNPTKMTGKSARRKAKEPTKTERQQETASAAPAVEVAPVITEPVLEQPKPRTPQEILAAARARRAAVYVVQATVDPAVTEALDLLSQEAQTLQANRLLIEAQRKELCAGLGRNVVPDALLREGIAKLDANLQEIDAQLKQIEIDRQALTGDNSVGIMLAILGQARLRSQARELLLGLTDLASSDTISAIWQKAFDLPLIVSGQDEISFAWNGKSWISAIASDPTAFGFVPRMRRVIGLYNERQAARRAKAQAHLIPQNEFEELAATAVDLSELIDGHEGHALIPMDNPESGDVLGHALVENIEGHLVVRRFSDGRIVNWFLRDNRNGELRNEVVLKRKPDGSFDHSHPGVRRCLAARLKANEPVRNQVSEALPDATKPAKQTRRAKKPTSDAQPESSTST